MNGKHAAERHRRQNGAFRAGIEEGRTWTLSQADIAAEIEHQAAYMADETEADTNKSKGPDNE